MIGNSFCALMIYKNPLKTVFFVKKAFIGLLKVIGTQTILFFIFCVRTSILFYIASHIVIALSTITTGDSDK